MDKNKKFLEDLIAHADVQVNGSRPWDIKVNDERLYSRILSGGSLALGESYMDGWWDCDAIDEFVSRVIGADLGKKISVGPALLFRYLQSFLVNAGSHKRAFEIGE